MFKKNDFFVINSVIHNIVIQFFVWTTVFNRRYRRIPTRAFETLQILEPAFQILLHLSLVELIHPLLLLLRRVRRRRVRRNGAACSDGPCSSLFWRRPHCNKKIQEFKV